MMTRITNYRISLILILLGCAPWISAQSKSKVIAKGASLVQVASDCKFTEGPAADRMGNVYFTDQPNDRILKWSVEDGSVSVFMEGTGRSNGLYFDSDGSILACADEQNQLWKISLDKVVTVLLDNFENKRFNGPNDLWVDPQGGIYFTDPFYKRPYWSHEEPELERKDVYYLEPAREKVRVVASDLVQPNGIIGTPDGRSLYVADIGDSKTYRYQIAANGDLTGRVLFVEMGSDGMTLDRKGNLYLTGDGVTVFNRKGKQIEHIPIEERWTANVCFGGEDMKTLFVTAMGSAYTLEMKVNGIR